MSLGDKIWDFITNLPQYIFFTIRYNYFQTTMAGRELSLEEANKLCQSALILICQQNQELKLKKNKSRNSPTPKQHHLFPLTTSTPPHTHSPLTPIPHPPASTHFSPNKHDRDTCHKLSIDRESEPEDLLEIQPKPQGQHSVHQGCRLVRFYSLPDNVGEGGKIPTEAKKEQLSAFSQIMNHEAPQMIPEGMIKQLKRDLEIKTRGKLCKTQEVDVQGKLSGIHFYCKHDQNCPFHCYLQQAGSAGQERLYRLTTICLQHLERCIESDEEVAYLRLTKLVDSMERWMKDLVQEKGWLKPKDILVAMAEQLGEEDYRFIYKGLYSKTYQKAAKKYFDNLVYKVKNPMQLA